MASEKDTTTDGSAQAVALPRRTILQWTYWPRPRNGPFIAEFVIKKRIGPVVGVYAPPAESMAGDGGEG